MSEGDTKLPEATQQVVEELLTALKSQSKLTRRTALEKFNHDTLKKCAEDAGPIAELYTAVSAHVLRALGDEAEACRAAAGETLHAFVQHVKMSDYQLTYIVPAIVKRIGQPEIVEQSEELRLQFVQLVRSVISCNEPPVLEPFINDFTSILCKTVQDPFPEARVEAASCIQELSVKIPRVFYMQSESFVKPILPSLSHQRFKVRVAAVQTLGAVVMAGQARCLELSVTPLAEKLFDEVGAVRRQVVREVARWMLEQRDRYSYWHRMLPTILTGLSDASEEIRTEAAQLWDKIGLKFLEENDEDLKKFTNFVADDVPEGYPDVPRPNFGCRTLVVRNIGKILPAIERECGGWQPDARYRVTQLLRWLLLCAEDGSTQNSLIAAVILQRAARDDDPRVVYEMKRSAEYYGIFVSPETWWPLLRPSLESWPTLLVLASVALGCRDKLLRNDAAVLKELMNDVADPDQCETRKERHQAALLSLCFNIMEVLSAKAAVVKKQLFAVTFTVYSSAEDQVKEKARETLGKLSAVSGYSDDDLGALYAEHAVSTLARVGSDPLAWSVAHPHYCLLYTILTEFGSALSVAAAELTALLRAALTQPKLDGQVKVKMFTALSLMLLEKERNFGAAGRRAALQFYRSLREDIIMAKLVWEPGMTAESVRCAAASCLCCLLQRGSEEPRALQAADHAAEVNIFETPEELAKVTDEIATLVPSLLDDRCDLTRRRALTLVVLCTQNAHQEGLFTVEHLHKMYYSVVKRLDDSSGEVRALAARALVALFRCRPPDYDRVQHGAHIEAVYSTMLVHLDDPDTAFRDHILKCLQELNDLDPELLMKKVQANLPLYTNKEAFESLQESLSKLCVKC